MFEKIVKSKNAMELLNAAKKCARLHAVNVNDDTAAVADMIPKNAPKTPQRISAI